MYRFIVVTILLVGVASILLPLDRAKALTISPVRFEISGESGQTLIGEITLSNEDNIVRTFYSSSENFEARGEGGDPYFKPAEEGLSTWIKTESKIVLQPEETKTVPFSIEIPEGADPGGHFAAIFWSNMPPRNEGEQQMIVGARLGTLVLLRVAGEIREGGGILEFGAENKVFTHLPISFFYRLANDGNDWIRPEGEIKIRNIIGLRTVVLDANSVQGNVLPGSVRRFNVEWSVQNETTKESGFLATAGHQWRNFAFGVYTATLNLSWGQQVTRNINYWFFIIPWQLLSIIIVILLIIGFLGTKGLKKYNRWIIAKATQK